MFKSAKFTNRKKYVIILSYSLEKFSIKIIILVETARCRHAFSKKQKAGSLSNELAELLRLF